MARSDNGGELYGDAFGEVCRQFCIEQKFSNTDSPRQNGVVERAPGIIQNAALAAFTQVELPPTKSPWVEGMHWANDALNHTATTVNPGNKPPHELWYGTTSHASPHPFLRPACCRRKRPSKSFPKAESCFYRPRKFLFADAHTGEQVGID